MMQKPRNRAWIKKQTVLPHVIGINEIYNPAEHSQIRYKMQDDIVFFSEYKRKSEHERTQPAKGVGKDVVPAMQPKYFTDTVDCNEKQ